ncbi:MAG TPA: CHASE4 domain-containing protein [Woeseiaceae bacterium]|nr:CHASE4 domain-containing protein [Woeseiaceae bacterium]
MLNRSTSWSLQKKVSVTLLGVMSTLVLLTYVILTAIVSPAFGRLETADATRNLSRAERAIRSEINVLDTIVRDWSSWDDTYAFARGENPGFSASNLDRMSLSKLNLDLVLIFDSSGREVWGQVLQGDATMSPAVLGVLDPAAPEDMPRIQHTRLDGYTRGLLRTNMGPMLFGSRPILTSQDGGPIAGTLIMGQFLDGTRMERLRERTEVELSWQTVSPDQAKDLPIELTLSADTSESMQHLRTADSITSFGVLNDLYDRPLLVLEVNTPRSLSALGGQTVNAALLFFSSAGIVVAIVTWLLLRNTIMLPLEGLARHITRIRESGNLTQKMNSTRPDEIGALATEFDKMTSELHDARRLLLEQSFKAGQADTAAEVLHNIRNAMTPLINGLDRLARQFKVADGLRISQVTGELRNPDGPAERREKLLQYVDSAFDRVKEVFKESGDEIHVVSRQARQVEGILSDQERHANIPPVMEDLDIAEILDEAVLVVPTTDHPDVEISMPKPPARCRVKAHRVGLLQVLGNVILNAYEAIKRGPSGSGRIQLQARVENVGDQAMVRVTVSDTGCGFDPQARSRIFQRGYSSKVGHMSGLGLHWCANALAGMGGRIVAESTGPGQGAEFHVLLPAAEGG